MTEGAILVDIFVPAKTPRTGFLYLSDLGVMTKTIWNVVKLLSGTPTRTLETECVTVFALKVQRSS